MFYENELKNIKKEIISISSTLPEHSNENEQLINKIQEFIANTINLLDKPNCYFYGCQKNVIFQWPEKIRNPTDNLISVKDDIQMYISGYEDTSKAMNELISEIKEECKNFLESNLNIEKSINNFLINFDERNEAYEIPKNQFVEFAERIILIFIEEEKKEGLFVEIKNVKELIKKFYSKKNEFEDKLYNLYKYVFEMINSYYNVIFSLCDPVNRLSDEVQKSLDHFRLVGEEVWKESEKSDDFGDLLLKLKEPLTIIKNKVDEEIKISEDIIQKFLESNKKEKINLNEFYCAQKELKDLSNEIRNKIYEIRKKYSYNPEELKNNKTFDIEITDINLLNDQIKSIENKVSDLSKNVCIKKMKLIRAIQQEQLNQVSLDLLIVLDCTESMDPYLYETQKTVFTIIKAIRKKCAGISVKYGFVGFRDFGDIDAGYPDIDLELTEKYIDIVNGIKDVECIGGDDIPENVAGGLNMANNKNWEANARYAILITDAPCHGANFHVTDLEDDYPENDKNNYDINKILRTLVGNKINLFAVKITDDTDIMYNKFMEAYKDSDVQFKIVELGKNPEKLADIISETASMTYSQKRHNKKK